MHYINKNVRDQVQYFFFLSHQLLTFIANVCFVYLAVHRIETVVWASTYDLGLVARKPVFMRKRASNQSPQLQRLARS